MSVDPQRLLYTNVSLGDLLQQAFRMQREQIIGPSWQDSERFDIRATLAPGSLTSEVPEMIYGLLVERFGLVVHRETRPLSGYGLRVAAGGVRMRVTEQEAGLNGQFGRVRSRAAGSASMSSLSRYLSDRLGRVVKDETGLAGIYVIALEWWPEPEAGALPSAASATPGSAAPAEAVNGPSLLAAVEQQLGLELRAEKASTEVVVVDHVDREPREN